MVSFIMTHVVALNIDVFFVYRDMTFLFDMIFKVISINMKLISLFLVTIYKVLLLAFLRKN